MPARSACYLHSSSCVAPCTANDWNRSFYRSTSAKGSMLQQLAHVHYGLGEGLESGLVAGMENGFRAVTGEMRLTIHLNRQVNQIDDPNFGDSSATVGGKFFLLIGDQGRIRNFNQQIYILRLGMTRGVAARIAL